MNLNNLTLLDLQTTYMKQDKTTIALCSAIDNQFKKLADETKFCLIYSRINELDEIALDELAWQLSIDWYDSNSDVEIKRKLIKSAIKIHKYRGTPAAVEDVIETYFGDGKVEEWFEYGGKPYTFRVVTSNASINEELANQFIKVLNSVKNGRSHLEAIIITLTAEMNIYMGGKVHIGDYLTIRQVI